MQYRIFISDFSVSQNVKRIGQFLFSHTSFGYVTAFNLYIFLFMGFLHKPLLYLIKAEIIFLD